MPRWTGADKRGHRSADAFADVRGGSLVLRAELRSGGPVELVETLHLMENPPQHGMRMVMLHTSPADLPADLAEQVARACEPLADVIAAYVARQRQTPGPDGSPTAEVLTIALELMRPPTGRNELHTLAVLREFPNMGAGTGLAVLAEAALPVWRAKGVRVFERRSPRPSGASAFHES